MVLLPLTMGLLVAATGFFAVSESRRIHVIHGLFSPEAERRLGTLDIQLALIAVIAAILARGWLRRACFHAIAWIMPLALLAGIEAVALSVRLADRVAPLEDTSLLARKTPWPGYLYSDSSHYWDPGGFILYRQWQGDGISFNALGLRTAMPTPKAPGEWRIAVTGGSEVWGLSLIHI